MKRYPCALVCLVSSLVGMIDAGFVHAASHDVTPLGRVKAASPLRALVRDGYVRSPTFREVVDHIAASGWIVFAQAGRCPEPAAIACLLHFVGRFDNAPYLRVIVKHQHRHPDSVIASLGHELQHAREVVTAPEITDGEAISGLFMRIGSVSVQRVGVRTYETANALAVGEAVRRELLGNARSVSSARQPEKWADQPR